MRKIDEINITTRNENLGTMVALQLHRNSVSFSSSLQNYVSALLIAAK